MKWNILRINSKLRYIFHFLVRTSCLTFLKKSSLCSRIQKATGDRSRGFGESSTDVRTASPQAEKG